MVTYDVLCRLMSEHPELLILRSYSTLNIKSLLYYEAELAHLEVELMELESEDRYCGSSPRKDFATDWKSLSTSSKHASLLKAYGQPRNERDALQWQTMCRIRSVLRDYNDAVTQYAQLSTVMSKSSTRDLHNLRKWLEQPGYGENFLRGKVESVWDEDKAFDDLCSFVRLQSADSGLTSYLSNIILHLKRWWTSPRNPPNHIYALEERTQEWIASGIMTVVSSVFPVVPIVILFFIDRLLVRLGLILVFTAVFAGVLVFRMRMEPDKTLAITTA